MQRSSNTWCKPIHAVRQFMTRRVNSFLQSQTAYRVCFIGVLSCLRYPTVSAGTKQKRRESEFASLDDFFILPSPGRRYFLPAHKNALMNYQP